MRIPARAAKYAAPATNAGLLLLGAAYIQYCRDGVVEYHHFIHGYSMDVLLQILLYVAGFLLVVFGTTNRWTLRIVLGVALATRLVGIFAPAFLSSDVYRYVWDGKVQAAGINPYRYIPADPHLTFLRDAQIYSRINRKNYAHTIYPPGAQILFLGVTRVSATAAGMKTAMVGFEALAIWALLEILKLFGRRREEVLLYAWHPLCVWEIGSSGHIDAVAIGLLSVAALALLRGKIMRSAGWITAAAMVKMYPLLLLLALGRRISMRMIALCVGIIVAGYALYSSVGAGVLGFMGGYVQEEGLKTGARYFLLTWAHRYLRLPDWPALYVAFCALALAAVAGWGLLRERQPKQMLGVALTITVLATIFFSPHYPWYFLWIVPFAVMLRYLPAIALTLEAAYWYGTSLALPGERMFRMDEYMYAIFLAAIAVDLLVRWWAGRQSPSPPAERLRPSARAGMPGERAAAVGGFYE